jgi:hypothetical protein
MKFRRGESVRVRSVAEILSTLDENGATRGMPFMPEMLKFAGQELTVSASAHKACDTVDNLGGTRGLERTVHLTGARCDGSAHGGCQAACLLFFREEWLTTEPVAQEPVSEPKITEAGLTATTQNGDTYHCQATALAQASTVLPSSNLSQYVTDIKSRNVKPGKLIKGVLITFFNVYQWKVYGKLPKWLTIAGGKRYPFYGGTGDGKRVPSGEIQPGDLVEVRSKPEIMATLNTSNKNGGMLFDSEQLPFCGQRARVERKIEQIIDEPTGKMIKLRDCLILENVVCEGIYHKFCPRGGLPYWRETWLRKVDDPEQAQPVEISQPNR